MAKISIIIPVYRTEQFLDKCVYSVLSSSFSDIEVFLVDDGSPDGLMCDKYPLEDERVRLIRFPQNRGLSAARNEGITLATSPYVSFVDSDDWVHPHMLERLFSLVVKHGAQIASCCATETVEGKRRMKLTKQRKKEIVMDRTCAMGRLLLSDPCAPHMAWGKLYDRKLFENVRYPEGRLHEDAAVTYRLYHLADKVAHTHIGYYFYTIRDSSLSNKGFTHKSMDKLKAADEIIEFVRENCPELTLHAHCFRLVTALRLVADFDKAGRKTYETEYNKVRQILMEKPISPMLSSRHRLMLYVYKHCQPLYRFLWDLRLNRRRAFGA